MRAVIVAVLLLAMATTYAGAASLRACAADQARLCPGHRDASAARACLAQHHVSLTLGCREALAASRAQAKP